jgi:hypothetical protein
MGKRGFCRKARTPTEIAQLEANAALVRRAYLVLGSKAAFARRLSEEHGKAVTGGEVAHWEDTSRSVPEWVLAVCREVVA